MASNLNFETANYPNPFNPSRLTVYSILGQQVRQLVDAVQGAGVYRVDWDGRDRAGQPVAPGIYVYRLEAGQQVRVRKMVFTK